MNKQQLTDLVIIPTLKEIPYGYSEAAVMANQMIIAHESTGGVFIAQNNGPALGVIQMEPETHDQTWKWGDSIWNNALLLGIISDKDFRSKLHPDAKRLIYDLRYNVFMVRQKLFMAAGALPKDVKGMSIYLKTHWNGDGPKGGKATAEKYYNDFMGWS